MKLGPRLACADHLYQWEASLDDNASPGPERIKATLLAINSANDERNPPELGLLDREIQAALRQGAPRTR